MQVFYTGNKRYNNNNNTGTVRLSGCFQTFFVGRVSVTSPTLLPPAWWTNCMAWGPAIPFSIYWKCRKRKKERNSNGSPSLARSRTLLSLICVYRGYHASSSPLSCIFLQEGRRTGTFKDLIIIGMLSIDVINSLLYWFGARYLTFKALMVSASVSQFF